MAIQVNPSQQAGVFNVCSSDLLKKGPQKTPQDLGLQPIQNYNYLVLGNIEPEDRETVTENIREAKKNPNMYYFSDDNPFVVEYCPNMQYIWKAVNECYDFDIFMLGSYLIDQHNQSIHLNAGSHGDPEGIMVSDLFAFEGARIAGLAHNQHSFPWDNLKNINGKSSLNPVSTGNKPDYPPKANHVIYVWCFSFSTLFSSQRRYLEPTDHCGNPIPSLYKCTASQKPLIIPFYHPECTSIKVQRHYYDIATIIRLITQNSERLENRWQTPTRLTALVTVLAKTKKAYDDCFKRPSERLFEGLFNQKGEDYRYKIYCRLEGCTNVIDIREFKRDASFESSLSRYKETVVKANREMNLLIELNSEKDQEITRIQGESQHKTHRITFLEKELDTKDQTIIGLQGRVTVEISEKQQLKQEKVEALLQQEAISRENRVLKQGSALVIKRQKDVISQLEKGLRPKELQELNEMTVAFQNACIREPQVKVRERVALMELGDFSTPLNVPIFVENAKRRMTVTNELLKELKNFNGLLTQGWIYEKTPFIKKGETEPEEFLQDHVCAFRRYIDEVVRAPYNTIIHEASCQLLLKLDREASLYKDILKITYESSFKMHRNLQNTELLWRELEDTLENVHKDLYSILKDKHLRLKTPTRQDYHVTGSKIIKHDPEVNWEQEEKDMTEIAVIGSKTYVTKLSEILSRLMAIRWCEENNRLLHQFLNSCM